MTSEDEDEDPLADFLEDIGVEESSSEGDPEDEDGADEEPSGLPVAKESLGAIPTRTKEVIVHLWKELVSRFRELSSLTQALLILFGGFILEGVYPQLAQSIPNLPSALPEVSQNGLLVILIAIMISQTWLQTRRLNTVRDELRNMRGAETATDGGQTELRTGVERETPEVSTVGPDGDDGTTGGGAIGGAIAGAAIGSSYGPPGTITGALLGLIFGDEIEERFLED